MLHFLYIIYIVLLKIVRHVRQSISSPTKSKADPCLTDFCFTRQALCDPLQQVSFSPVLQLSHSFETRTHVPQILDIFAGLYTIFNIGINQSNNLYFVIFVQEIEQKLCYKLLQSL